jgi:alpha/beta superfamily hydrolase
MGSMGNVVVNTIVRMFTASGVAALLVPLIGGALGGLWGAKTGRNRP